MTREGQGGVGGIYRTIYDFAYNRHCYLYTLKGLISCFKSQKSGFSLEAKKGASVLRWLKLTNN
jgi:hypothetical protein